MRALAIVVLVGVGCSASGPEAVMAAPVGTVVDVRAVPWPSDALLGTDGRLAVAPPFPFDSSGDGENLRNLATTLSDLDGFGTVGSVFFPVSADVVLDPGATATLVNLDAPNERRELTLFYRKDTKQLVAMAPIGMVLKEHHPYGCWVAKGVQSLSPSGVMNDAIAGRGAFGQKGAYPKLATLLAAEKVRPLAATAFTTQTLTAWVPKVLADLAAMPPKAKVTRLFAGAALDELFGGPVTTTRPGKVKMSGVLHDAVAFAVEGTFGTPHYLTATPGKLGLFDAALTVKSVENVPFMLVLPKRPAGFAGTPVVIFQHGIDDDRKAVLEVANSFCRAGIAVIGIDELWHGSRLPENVDLVNNLTETILSPDGIGDPASFGGAQYFFNLKGDQQQHIASLDPRYIRDSFRQATIDLMQLVRVARHGDFSEVAAADPALSGLTIDGSRLTYVSESFGSVLGAVVLALDPELDSAALDVGGGGIIIDLVGTSAEAAQLLQPFVAGAFDLQVDVNSPAENPLRAQMSITILQTVIESGDGLALSQAADPGKQVLFLESYADEAMSNYATEGLARAWGAVQVNLTAKSRPARILDFNKVSAPYSVDGGVVRALVVLDPSSHGMITQQEGEARFFPDSPPFLRRPTPLAINNPIEEVHTLSVKWAEAYRLTNHPAVVDP